MDKRFEDGFGNVFTEEEAMNDVREQMTTEDYLTFGDFDIEKILEWCFKQEGFYETFCEDITRAEQEYFDEFYIEVDDEEE